MLAARRTNHRADGAGDPVGAVPRGPATIPQPQPPAFVKAREPLVARLAADPVPGAEFGHRVQLEAVIANESLTLLHG